MPGRSAKEIYAEHREFARRYGQPVESTPHANAKDVNRRLRIGYISGDFRDHSVAFFIESVLERHNRKAFEVFCYYNFMHADSVTERLKARADHWRDVAALNDDDLVSLIRSDVIDILIDLSGHTAHNRLLALARKPAPVQVTWLGYLNTTGLDAMDYRITDAHASPEALFDDVHTEELIRLPGSQWCYRPHKDSPGIVPPPSIKSGFITFGAFTNLAKIGQPVIDLWSRLLEKMPESRLLIVGRGLGTVGDDFLSRFARNGLAVERISLREFGPFEEYLSLHDTVDIVLDTFPFTGGTTSCHALWMGVPIVTIVGDTPASRGGASILNTIGLGEFVAQTAQQYLDVAANLASNPGRLAELRATMRERMAASPLMDETRFTRHLEKAFRSMWRTWCKKNQ
jgi:predicted O-linked N-acetylglucosamine transferase (SPINDLY family)